MRQSAPKRKREGSIPPSPSPDAPRRFPPDGGKNLGFAHQITAGQGTDRRAPATNPKSRPETQRNPHLSHPNPPPARPPRPSLDEPSPPAADASGGARLIGSMFPANGRPIAREPCPRAPPGDPRKIQKKKDAAGRRRCRHRIGCAGRESGCLHRRPAAGTGAEEVAGFVASSAARARGVGAGAGAARWGGRGGGRAGRHELLWSCSSPTPCARVGFGFGNAVRHPRGSWCMEWSERATGP